MNLSITEVYQRETTLAIYIVFTLNDFDYCLTLSSFSTSIQNAYDVVGVTHWNSLSLTQCPFCKEESNFQTRCEIVEKQISSIFPQLVLFNELRLFWLYHDAYYEGEKMIF